MSLLEQLVPSQKKGFQSGATSKRELESRHAALSLFRDAKERLAGVNQWHALCENKGAEFQLTDQKGNPVFRAAQKDDLIRINLPAPPSAEGKGYDWVSIESVVEEQDRMRDEEAFGFRVRPVANPLTNSHNDAHFYTSDATSTFLILRITNTVYAIERGKNEIPNNSGSVINRVRNLLVAIPAMLGLAKSQWKLLTESLLKAPLPKQ